MTRLRIILLVAVLLAALAALLPQLSSAAGCPGTINWVGPAGGSWATPANWDTGVVPAASDDVCIPTGTSVVHSSGTDSINSLTANGSLTLSNGTLTLASISTATDFTLSGGTLAGAGELDLSGASNTWSGGSMDGTGITKVLPTATLRRSGASSVTLSNGRQLEVEGTLDLPIAQPIFSSGAPSIHVAAGGVVQRNSTTGTAAIYPPLDNDGTLEARKGTLDIRGPFTAGGSTTMRVLIAGPNAGDFGKIAIAGAVDLTGTLEIVTDASYQPTAGTQFDIVTYGSHTGTFGTVTGTDAGGGAHYEVGYGSSAVTLTVAGGPPPPPDSDGDGVLDSNDRCPTVFAQTADGCPLPPPEPKKLADLPPPVIGVEANVEPKSGTVLVAIPVGSAGAGSAHAAQKGLKFVPLAEARQVPIGSFLDTRKGTVTLQSATGAANKSYLGDFTSGLFQVLQARKKSAKGLTDLVLKGGKFSSCATKKRKRGKRAQAALSKRALRRLRGNAKGRFRTRGRYSAATVRGTKWTVTDRCDGTLTKVTRGKVAVRDFRRKKTVLVKTGKSYLAKAKR